MEAQPNPSPQRTQGKAQAGGCFSESKSSQAAKTFMISTAEVAEEAEVFWGCNVGPTLFVACQMIAEFAAIPPKKPLLPLLPLRFKVCGFDFVLILFSCGCVALALNLTENFLQQIRRLRRRVFADFLLFLAEHVEKTVERFADDITIEIALFAG